ncbi:MAG: glycosyltransferase [Candidatus Abyssubacteria bacterium]|nr:glycosyltransferase [Candidatus Abyssubacteria bacterium]
MLFVCIPAYNEEENIGRLLDRLRSSLQPQGFDYEIIVYDDHSEDGTNEIVRNRMDSMPIRLMRGEVNKGLICGMRELIECALVRSSEDDDIMVMMDGDDTHDPRQIPEMVDMLRQGFDVVIASRFRGGSRIVGVPMHRSFVSLAACLIMKTVFPINGVMDYTSGYRAYRLDILRRAADRYGRSMLEAGEFACTAELLIKLRALGLRATETPIELRYDRKTGNSKMRVLKNIISTLKMLFVLRFKMVKKIHS